MFVEAHSKAKALYSLLAEPALGDTDAKVVVSELCRYLAAQVQVALGDRPHETLLLVPILRGGMLLYPAFSETFRAAAVGLVQIARSGVGRKVIYECFPSEVAPGAVVYLDAVAGTGLTIECASRLVHNLFGEIHEVVCLIAATSDATTVIRKAGMSVVGVSLDEGNIDGLVVPDLGMRDAGDLAWRPSRGQSEQKPFPIASFESFHEQDGRAQALRAELVYRTALTEVRTRPATAILDIGCGTGRLTEELARYGTRTVGYDVSESVIDLARELNPSSRVTYTTTIAAGMCKAFDFVNCCMVLNSTGEFERVVELAKRCSATKSTQVWTILHPAFQFNESQWRARKAISATNMTMTFSLLPSYFEEHSFEKQVGAATLTEYHRPLSKYINRLLASGFRLISVGEPQAAGIEPHVVEHFLPRVMTLITTLGTRADEQDHTREAKRGNEKEEQR